MERIEVSGCRLGIQTHGDGDPPVVFVPALGLDHTQWDPVLAELTTSTTVVLYDRPTLGVSDPLPPEDARQPRTAGWAADQLNSLLNKAGVPSPRVLVGHSVGGMIVERYGVLFPADTAGLVMLDASQPHLLQRDSDQANGCLLDGYDEQAINFDPVGSSAEYDAEGPAAPFPVCVVISRALGSWNVNDPERYAPLSPREVDDSWQNFQRQLAARYDGHLIVTHFSDHMLPANVPGLVAQVIDAVVIAVRRQDRRVALDRDAIYNAGGRVIPADGQ
ncbi:alpha/beta fold hydrolase [Flindersiella endophytica]